MLGQLIIVTTRKTDGNWFEFETTANKRIIPRTACECWSLARLNGDVGGTWAREYVPLQSPGTKTSHHCQKNVKEKVPRAVVKIFKRSYIKICKIKKWYAYSKKRKDSPRITQYSNSKNLILELKWIKILLLNNKNNYNEDILLIELILFLQITLSITEYAVKNTKLMIYF